MTTSSQLIRKVMNRTEEVEWAAVYADLLPRVYNFFRYRVRDRVTAEDLTATTLEKAWRNRSRYRRDLASFSTWVLGIARNLALSYYRQQRREIPLDAARDEANDSIPGELVQRQSEAERLFVLVNGLPVREQELIALKYGADLTNREIARVTGLSESNVGTILSRVVHKLRTEWEPKP